MSSEHQWHILLWIPNIIGYLRLLLCILATLYHDEGNHLWCILFFLVNFALDGVDGYLARKFNQTSSFGAWLDVFVDLVARGFLWIIVNKVLGYAIITWEWLAFFAIHTLFGRTWKEPPKAPSFVTAIMRNNFKTVHGFYIIGSLFLLPAWCYVMLYLGDRLPIWLSYNIQLSVLAALILGRCLAATAECWYISHFMKSLLLVRDDKGS